MSSIVVAPDGALWFLTSGSGVSRYDGKTWTTYTHDDGLASDSVSSFAMSPDGALWLAAYDGGVSRFDSESGPDKAWTSYTSRTSGLPRGFNQAPVFDHQGRAWFAGYGGTAMLDLSTGQRGCIPQTVADTWAAARIVAVLAAISLPFLWLGRRVAAGGPMGWAAAIILFALAGLLVLGALGCAIVWLNLRIEGSLQIGAALVAIAIGLAAWGGIGLRRLATERKRLRARERGTEPAPTAIEAGAADLGTLESDALVEMLRHTRDPDERERVVSELERRGMVEEM